MPPTQPDFDALKASMHNAANGFRNSAMEMDKTTNEIYKIQHMAAADMARQLNRIQAQLTRMERNLVRQASRSYVSDPSIHQQYLSICLPLTEVRNYSDNNNLARTFNSRIVDERHRLEPLYNMENELIPGFPQTGEEIKKLNGKSDICQTYFWFYSKTVCVVGASVDALLKALGLPIKGRMDAKKRRFCRYIGLMINERGISVRGEREQIRG